MTCENVILLLPFAKIGADLAILNNFILFYKDVQ